MPSSLPRSHQVTILSIDGDFAVVVVEDGEPSTVPLSALSPVHDLLQPQAVKRLSSLVDAYLAALPLYMQCAQVGGGCWVLWQSRCARLVSIICRGRACSPQHGHGFVQFALAIRWKCLFAIPLLCRPSPPPPLHFPLWQLEPPLTHGKVLVSEATEVVVESEHPYLNDTNKMYTISIPGAASIKLKFDPRSKTEDNYDYVTLYKDAAKSAWIGPKEKFCGSSFGTDEFEVAQDQVCDRVAVWSCVVWPCVLEARTHSYSEGWVSVRGECLLGGGGSLPTASNLVLVVLCAGEVVWCCEPLG
jgi:hypothetical protein